MGCAFHMLALKLQHRRHHLPYGSRNRRFVKHTLPLFTPIMLSATFRIRLHKGSLPNFHLTIRSPLRWPVRTPCLFRAQVLPTTMGSADFSLCTRHSEISPGKSLFLPPISTGSTCKVPSGFPPFGLRYDVLPHPTLPASVSSSCSLEPGFAVSLPSVYTSR